MTDLNNLNIDNLITDNINVWTSAIKKRNSQGRGSNSKVELTGVKKLRELILELAVRGKLVSQDTNDEPASVLLEKIAEEKAQLIADKKLKKQKALPEVSDEEVPFKLPNGWGWTRLGIVTEINPRNHLIEDADLTSYVPMPLVTTSYKGLHGQEIRKWAEIKKGYTHFADGDIGLAKITPCFENSKAAVFSGLKNGVGAGTTELHVARPFGEYLDRLFILLFLKAPQFLLVGETKMTGSAGQKRVPKDFFSESPIPLPPLAEQHRIVAKVDELMALCDQLEQQTEQSLTAHQTLVEALLNTLTQSVNADDFQASWQRIADHFDALFITETSIDQLKQTILQLAVMGKLVPQNPSDEPASKLLEKIAEEKAQLIKDKKIKKQKPLPAISDKEKPFELPSGWEWSKLGYISLLKGGFAYKSSLFVDSSLFQVVRMGNIRPDRFRLNEKAVFIDSDLAGNTDDYQIISGDILLTMTGTKGKRDYLYSLLVNDSDLNARKLYLNQRLCIARPLLADNSFINLILKEGNLLDFVYAKSTGTANQANIGMEAIQNWVLLLPPLAEQQRIVAKVDELMTLCYQLKVRLNDAQITQLHLADAVVENALN